ncbi:MAG TPA: MlaD family protein, partial [Solirubrobacteraceae bacterium]|nr:MlaD family protein [Solirubrobacteraceae bacterium]
MRRRGGASIAANPVLIGAATTLVVIVAVFLAYNANNGLPFVPTYELKAEVPNAANLVVGNDVRLGGARVGVVDKISPKENADGSVTAILDLKLQTNVKPLPKDSTLIIRPRSALGLKYVEITRGNARNAAGGFADGATIPLANARPAPVEFDEVINMFDEPVRAASRVNLVELGNGLAGRGQNLNDAIKGLNPLLEELTPVMENLSSRQTNLSRFVSELADTVSIIAPVAETQADLFVNLDTTFAALAEVSPFIQQTLEGGPPALQEGIDSFPV